MSDEEEKDVELVSMPLQEAVTYLQRQIAKIESVTVAQIALDKLVLRALLDLGQVELESLTAALTELADSEEDGSTAQNMFLGLITSFEASHGQSAERPDAPHLRLVPKAGEEPER